MDITLRNAAQKAHGGKRKAANQPVSYRSMGVGPFKVKEHLLTETDISDLNVKQEQ